MYVIEEILVKCRVKSFTALVAAVLQSHSHLVPRKKIWDSVALHAIPPLWH